MNIYIYIFVRPRILTLNDGQKKRCHSSRENCWRSVEKSKDFGQSRSGFKVKLCMCVYKERRGRGGRENREENKSEERGEKEEKSGRRTFFAVKFSSMDEMNCTRDHK